MFGKSEPNITSGFINISFNIAGIREWLKGGGEIGAHGKWESFSPVVTHSIDYLAKASVYFHRSANQFSNGMTGSHFIDDEIDVIQWDLVQDEESIDEEMIAM